MQFTKIPENTFQEIQLNAGILLDEFTPATGEIGNIIGATTGGVSFTATPAYVDFGEDVDNCAKNTKELKKLDDWTATMSGSFVTINLDQVKDLLGAADSTAGTNLVTPRVDLLQSDFKDLWWVGDYSDKNSGTDAGFVAIHMMNALSTGGFKIQSSDRNKGQFEFEYTAHYSIAAQSTVPFEVYVKAGA